MSQTYQEYLSSLNTEILNKDNDWGQHYDMESQILINSDSPLTHIILNEIKQIKQIRQIKQIKQINSEIPHIDIESGLTQSLKKYITKQSANTQCNYKSSFIASIIYISHLILFIMLFK
jgi:hypothetical protein